MRPAASSRPSLHWTSPLVGTDRQLLQSAPTVLGLVAAGEAVADEADLRLATHPGVVTGQERTGSGPRGPSSRRSGADVANLLDRLGDERAQARPLLSRLTSRWTRAMNKLPPLAATDSGAAPVPELTDVAGRRAGSMSRPWPLRQPLFQGSSTPPRSSQALRAPIGLPRQALTDVLGNDEGLARLWTAIIGRAASCSARKRMGTRYTCGRLRGTGSGCSSSSRLTRLAFITWIGPNSRSWPDRPTLIRWVVPGRPPSPPQALAPDGYRILHFDGGLHLYRPATPYAERGNTPVRRMGRLGDPVAVRPGVSGRPVVASVLRTLPVAEVTRSYGRGLCWTCGRPDRRRWRSCVRWCSRTWACARSGRWCCRPRWRGAA